jgi:hypothetical protein
MVSAKEEDDYFRLFRFKAGMETGRYIPAKVHGGISWKTVIFKVTAVRTSNFTLQRYYEDRPLNAFEGNNRCVL